MKEAALVIIKPDGISKRLVGHVMNKFAETGVEIAAMKIAKTNKELVEEHYRHIKGRPFFNDVVEYLLGKYHKQKKLLAIIYCGKDAIKKCRKIAGATNPEEADPSSIRGAFGRITTNGIFENVVHVSSDKKEAEREIKLWFKPSDITDTIYPTRLKVIESHKEKVWA
ncbi:MAG: nucleoside-diphosphate kinase [Candidatus Omnitrophica bacterium]|nr:nucleoside-diphosphate kinase [Candidatus Omnitrophota bacterium]